MRGLPHQNLESVPCEIDRIFPAVTLWIVNNPINLLTWKSLDLDPVLLLEWLDKCSEHEDVLAITFILSVTQTADETERMPVEGGLVEKLVQRTVESKIEYDPECVHAKIMHFVVAILSTLQGANRSMNTKKVAELIPVQAESLRSCIEAKEYTRDRQGYKMERNLEILLDVIKDDGLSTVSVLECLIKVGCRGTSLTVVTLAWSIISKSDPQLDEKLYEVVSNRPVVQMWLQPFGSTWIFPHWKEWDQKDPTNPTRVTILHVITLTIRCALTNSGEDVDCEELQRLVGIIAVGAVNYTNPDDLHLLDCLIAPCFQVIEMNDNKQVLDSIGCFLATQRFTLTLRPQLDGNCWQPSLAAIVAVIKRVNQGWILKNGGAEIRRAVALVTMYNAVESLSTTSNLTINDMMCNLKGLKMITKMFDDFPSEIRDFCQRIDERSFVLRLDASQFFTFFNANLIQSEGILMLLSVLNFLTNVWSIKLENHHTQHSLDKLTSLVYANNAIRLVNWSSSDSGVLFGEEISFSYVRFLHNLVVYCQAREYDEWLGQIFLVKLKVTVTVIVLFRRISKRGSRLLAIKTLNMLEQLYITKSRENDDYNFLFLLDSDIVPDDQTYRTGPFLQDIVNSTGAASNTVELSEYLHFILILLKMTRGEQKRETVKMMLEFGLTDKLTIIFCEHWIPDKLVMKRMIEVMKWITMDQINHLSNITTFINNDIRFLRAALLYAAQTKEGWFVKSAITLGRIAVATCMSGHQMGLLPENFEDFPQMVIKVGTTVGDTAVFSQVLDVIGKLLDFQETKISISITDIHALINHARANTPMYLTSFSHIMSLADKLTDTVELTKFMIGTLGAALKEEKKLRNKSVAEMTDMMMSLPVPTSVFTDIIHYTTSGPLTENTLPLLELIYTVVYLKGDASVQTRIHSIIESVSTSAQKRELLKPGQEKAAIFRFITDKIAEIMETFIESKPFTMEELNTIQEATRFLVKLARECRSEEEVFLLEDLVTLAKLLEKCEDKKLVENVQEFIECIHY